MTIDDNSIFDTQTSLKKIEPSRTRVIVYTTNMEEQRPAAFNEVTVGGGSTNGDDVAQYYKEVTVNYISKQTQNAGNDYQLAVGSIPTTLKNPDGSPAAISDQPGGVIRSFSSEFQSEESQKALSTFKQSSDSQFLQLNVKKGKGLNSQDPSVIELYSQINPENEADPGLLPRTVQERLTENNLLNPVNKLIAGELTVKENTSKIGSLILQPKIGSHSPRKFPAVQSDNSVQVSGERLETLTIEELKELGGRILFAAGGGDIKEGTTQVDVDTTPPDETKYGIKVPFNRFTATEVVQAAKPNFVKPKLEIELSDETRYSYGSMNTPAEMFNSQFSSAGIYGIVKTIMLAIAEIADLASQIPYGSIVPHPPLATTANKATECILIGFELFFSQKLMLPVYNSMHSDQGYKTTILRRMMQILFEELGLDKLTVPDPIAMATLAKNLLNSKFINIMNIILLMGDRAITMARQASISPNDYIGQYIDTINSKRDDINIADIKINPASLISRTKLSTVSQGNLYNTKISWAANSTPSMYILPQSIKTAEEKLTGNNNYLNKISSKKYVKTSNVNRLTPNEVRAVENILDASYVPFYFHDLRTNEIISFHAFLNSIEDSFNANYQSDVVYGRADPVHIYKNTERSINLEFIVAAVNEADFDQMWYKINKFITLVYPQYTAGRQLSYQNSQFYQPFSQIPAASPMIRMRVGDLIKSNYSTFGMGRLFGLAQLQGFNINPATPQEQQASQQQQAATAEQTAQVTQRMQSGNFAVGEKFILNWTAGIPVNSLFSGQFFCRGVNVPQNIVPWDIAATVAGNPIDVTVIAVENTREGKEYTLRAVEPPDLEHHPGLKLDFIFVVAMNTADSSSGTSQSRWTYGVKQSEVTRVANQLANPTATVAMEGATSTQAFLSTVNNPILRAFETTRGDGLAGFITNIKMDWMMQEGIWETVGYGNRAPMMCKIAIQYKPIFDLPPGLDSNGFMNAPVYPVGDTSNAMIIDTETNNTTQDKINSFNSLKSKSNRNITPPTTEPTTRENVGIPGIGRSGVRLFGQRII